MSTENSTGQSNLCQSMAYAERGFPVFPVNGKKPFESGGFRSATTDQAQLETWAEQYPDCNWGTPTGHHVDAITGEPNARPFDVLDVDLDKAGFESLEALLEAHGALPETPRQRTGSGGQHICFASDGSIGNSAGKLAPGIDVRGTGGFIVLAPSEHPKTLEPYQWLTSLLEVELAPMPAWLCDAIGESKRQSSQRTTHIPQGQRNPTLASEAGRVRRQGASRDAILAYLRTRNQEACDPPLEDAELQQIAESVSAYDPADPLITFAKTDAGNAERFAYVNEGRVIYCAPLRKWFVWDGRRWAPDETHQVDRLAIETIRLTGHRAIDMPTDTRDERGRRDAMVNWALASESDKRLTDMVKRARGLVAVLPKALGADPMKLCVKNGVIDLTTGQLLPHDPADFITKLAPVEYDPDATLPEWDAFLSQTLAGKEGLADFLQMAMGYSLTGLTSEEKLFFIYGPAGSGKSTFVEAFKAILGDYAKTSDFDAFIKHQGSGGPRNDIARLNGARYVSSIEVEQGKALAEALIKTISGGDMVAARFLFAESIEFKPSLKLWLVANDAPGVNADDEGMWRRILRVPFDNVVPEDQRDPRIKALLNDPERSGAALLAWAVKGCLKWQETGRLVVPEVVKEDTARYRAEQDGLAGFLAEACDVGPEHQSHTQDLFGAYEGYWQAYGRYQKERRLSKQGFSRALKARGYEDGRPRINGKQGRGWFGIAAKPLDEVL